MHARVKTSLQEIDEALARAASEPEGPTLSSVVYRPEPGLDLFLFTLKDGRRLSIPRENLQALENSTLETAADFQVSPFGDTVWWNSLDEGVTLDGLLEGRLGDKAWMEHLLQTTQVAA